MTAPIRPSLTFPDLTAWAKTYLAPRLNVPVVATIPHSRPQRFVLVEATGGSQQSDITMADTLNVTTYGADISDAKQIALLVQRLLNEVTRDDHVRRARAFIGPFPFDDPADVPAVKTTYTVQTRAR